MKEETREVIVRIEPRLRGRRVTNEQRLSEALRIMRIGRFEVDIYRRGTWYRDIPNGPRYPRVIEEHLLEHWQWDGKSLRVADDVGSWLPAIGRNPPPELVLRGTRRVIE